jgi:transcriptional regulator with XRE-family HTH domain
MTPVEAQICAAVRALAWNVREWRTFRQATVERLAELAELSPRHIQKIEAGEANVTLATIVKVAFALGVDLRDLFAPLRR